MAASQSATAVLLLPLALTHNLATDNLAERSCHQACTHMAPISGSHDILVKELCQSTCMHPQGCGVQTL